MLHNTAQTSNNSYVTSVTEVRRQAYVCLPVRGTPWWVLLQHSIMLWSFVIIECGIAPFLCTMRVFDVRASSSAYATFLPNFISFAALIADLAHGEKSCTQWLNHSPSWFDTPGSHFMGMRFTGLCHCTRLNCTVVSICRVKYLIPQTY